MPEHKKYIFTPLGQSSAEVISMIPVRHRKKHEKKDLFKKELIEVFQKFGYLEEEKDYEVRIKTTSGNIAWININSIETIK